MERIESSLRDLKFLEDLSYQDTFIHRLDPRVKIAAVLSFVAVVISYNRYEVASLLPYAFFLIFLVGAGNIPPSFIFKRILALSPFVILVGIFNPLLDRAVFFRAGNLSISGGWVSFAAIILRYCLTVSAALILIAATGFNTLCFALERLGVPKVFVVQLLLLHRYLFVLTAEASRMTRARSLRSFGKGAMEIRVFIPLVGSLLIRAIDRAQLIYRSMLARGFDGDIRIDRALRIGWKDLLFITLWLSLIIIFRAVNPTLILGNLFVKVYL